MDPKDAPQETKEGLLKLLQELIDDDFKEFKYHLESLPVTDGKSKVPRGPLDTADRMGTIKLMLSHYGEQSAIQITANILNKIPRNDLTPRVEALQSYLGRTGKQSSAQIKEIETKEKFKELMKRRFRAMEDESRLPGERVLLQDCYTKLLILKKQRLKEEREDEIMASGRRHLELMAERASDSYSSIQELFKPEKDGHIPRTVVLQGVAGIGKTMTAQKILLDWASGDLFQGMFQYVFYIQCRELNQLGGQPTITDIILHICDGKPLLTMEAIEAEPQKVLFIIDGFDELKLPKDLPRNHPDKNPPSNKSIIHLVRRRYLPESFLLITTRPTALEALTQYLVKCGNDERFAEILGFSEDDRKEYFNKFFGNIYFNKFFGNKSQGAQAFNVVKENEILYTMCYVPIVCWIVCKVIKQQMETREEFVHLSKSTTSVYLLFLSGLLVKQSTGSQRSTVSNNLKRLCALAYEGICQQKILFEDEDLRRHGVDIPAVQSLFLTNDLFRKDDKRYNLYSFLHLSFQEFFAALYFILGEDEARAEHAESLLEEIEEYTEITRLLGDYSEYGHLMLSVRFLFGLLNSDLMEKMQGSFQWKISREIKAALLEWVKLELTLWCGSESPFWGMSDQEWDHQLELFRCLYETQDAEFVKQATEDGIDVDIDVNDEHLKRLRRMSAMDRRALAFYLEHSSRVKSMRVSMADDPEFWRALAPALMRCSRLRMEGRMDATAKCWPELLLPLRRNSVLTELVLDTSGVDPAFMKELCEALAHSDCKIQTLWFYNCSLTAAHCSDLASLIKRKPSLTLLGLWCNKLEDSGVKALCKGLEDPGCKIQALCLHDSSLTASCCAALSSVLSKSTSLINLYLGGNTLEDSGVELLCKGLKDPGCRLQSLRLHDSSLTASCCAALSSVLSKSTSLIELSLGCNKLGDSGVELLCKGLKDPGCRLQTLRLGDCSLTASCCAALSSVLSKSTSLIDLSLSKNKLGDSGVEMLCKGLKDPGCRLQELWLDCCSLTDACCEDLVSVLNQKPSLQDLRVDGNDWTEAARGKLREAGQSSGCRIHT